MRNSFATRLWFILGTTLLVGAISGVTPALAQVAAPLTTTRSFPTPLIVSTPVSQCITNKYHSPNLLYSVHSSQLKRDFSLYCQDAPGKGLLHINEGHPIPTNLSGEFSRCSVWLISRGNPNAPVDGAIYWQWTAPSGTIVGGYTDSASSGDIRTIFTKGAISNDWTKCSNA